MNRKKLAYISGPISGLPADQVAAAFANAEAELEALGYATINPYLRVAEQINSNRAYWSDFGVPEDEMLSLDCWEDCMQVALSLMLDADVIALLPDWEKSNGVHLELLVAASLKKEIRSVCGAVMFKPEVMQELGAGGILYMNRHNLIRKSPSKAFPSGGFRPSMKTPETPAEIIARHPSLRREPEIVWMDEVKHLSADVAARITRLSGHARLLLKSSPNPLLKNDDQSDLSG